MNLNDKINLLTEKANLENKVRDHNLKCFHTKNEALKHSETIKFIKYKGFVAITEDCIIGRNNSIYKSTEANNKDLYKILKELNYKEDKIESNIAELKECIGDDIKSISMTKKQKDQLITNLTFITFAIDDFDPIEVSLTKLGNISKQNNFGIFLNDLSDKMKMKNINDIKNTNNIKEMYEDLLEKYENQNKLTPEQLEEYKNVKIIQMFNSNGELTTNNEDAKLAWMIPLDNYGNPKSACEIEGIVGNNCGNGPNEYKTKYMLMLRPYNMDIKQTTHVVITVDKNKKIIEILGNSNSDVNVIKYGKHLFSLFTETDYIDLGIDSSKLKNLSNVTFDELEEINKYNVKEILLNIKLNSPNFNIDEVSLEDISNMKRGHVQVVLRNAKLKSPKFNIDNVSLEEIFNIKNDNFQIELIKEKIKSPNFNIDNMTLEEITNIESEYCQEILIEEKIKSPNFNIDVISLEEIYNITDENYQSKLLKEKIKSPNFNINDISLEEIIDINNENLQSILINEKIKSHNFNIDDVSFEEISNIKDTNVQLDLFNAKLNSPNFNIDDVSLEDIYNIKQEFWQTKIFSKKMKSHTFNIDDVSFKDISKIYDIYTRQVLLRLKGVNK